jgi:hypothetical protein
VVYPGSRPRGLPRSAELQRLGGGDNKSRTVATGRLKREIKIEDLANFDA